MTANEQKTALAYLYDGSLEGILCVIYDSYKRHEKVRDVYTLANAQPRIGQVFHEVKTNIEKATRVRQRLIDICGYDTYSAIRAASLSEDPAKGSACLSFARYALDSNRSRWKNPGAKRLDPTRAIANPETQPLLDLERYVMNERHYMQQFLRFEELEGDVWVATCHPKASVVPLLMDYFAARFNTQSFIIFDARHHLAGVYEGAWSQRPHKLLDNPKAFIASPKKSPSEHTQQHPQTNSREHTQDISQSRPKPARKPCPASGALAPQANQNYHHRCRQVQTTPSHSQSPWYLVQSEELTLPKRTDNEEAMRQAWKHFYQTVSIDERYNPELRRSFMPMRFWDDLTEMQLN